jgi:hypothetical protein
MQFSLMIYQTNAQFAARTDPARREANTAAFMTYVGAMQQAGVVEVRPTRVVPAA